jgi:hypothetical protein
MTLLTIAAQVIVAWVALDAVFCILWAWAAAPTLVERTREEQRWAKEGVR